MHCLCASQLDVCVCCRLAALPCAQSTTLQLCDLSAADLQHLLDSVVVQEACNAKTGAAAKQAHILHIDACAAALLT